MFADQETAIVARLKATVPDGTYVGTLDELEQVAEMRQRAPAVWVIYDGYGVLGRVPSRASPVANIRQDWFVVVATKSARGSGDNKAAKNAASLLARACIEALQGYHLGGGKYLQVEDAPGPEYDGGYCHVPLAFSSATTIKGTTT